MAAFQYRYLRVVPNLNMFGSWTEVIKKTLSENAKGAFGYLLCAFFFALIVIGFYPGYMSPDSTASWLQGRSGDFLDISSPVMSYLWGITDKIVPGPGGMFILQNLFFWSAAAIFWRATQKKSFWLGLTLVLFGFLPPIYSQLTTVWKDVHMAVSLFFASALIYYASQKNSKTAILLSILFLFYGCTARLNSLPAILPLTIWTGLVACRVFPLLTSKMKKTKLLPVYIGIIYFFLLIATTSLCINIITNGRTIYPFQQIYLYDLAAISIARNEPIFPDYILKHENYSFEKVRDEYNFRSVNSLIWGDRPSKGNPPILPWSEEPEKIKALRAKWFEAVPNNFAVYIKHRWQIFSLLIGTSAPLPSNLYWEDFEANPKESKVEQNFINKILMGYFDITRKIVFRSIIWLLPCLFLIYYSIKKRLRTNWETVFFLSSSGLLYALAYFPTTPSTEFRYVFWTAISSALSCIIGFYTIRSKI